MPHASPKGPAIHRTLERACWKYPLHSSQCLQTAIRAELDEDIPLEDIEFYFAERAYLDAILCRRLTPVTLAEAHHVNQVWIINTIAVSEKYGLAISYILDEVSLMILSLRIHFTGDHQASSHQLLATVEQYERSPPLGSFASSGTVPVDIIGGFDSTSRLQNLPAGIARDTPHRSKISSGFWAGPPGVGTSWLSCDSEKLNFYADDWNTYAEIDRAMITSLGQRSAVAPQEIMRNPNQFGRINLGLKSFGLDAGGQATSYCPEGLQRLEISDTHYDTGTVPASSGELVSTSGTRVACAVVHLIVGRNMAPDPRLRWLKSKIQIVRPLDPSESSSNNDHKTKVPGKATVESRSLLPCHSLSNLPELTHLNFAIHRSHANAPNRLQSLARYWQTSAVCSTYHRPPPSIVFSSRDCARHVAGANFDIEYYMAKWKHEEVCRAFHESERVTFDEPAANVNEVWILETATVSILYRLSVSYAVDEFSGKILFGTVHSDWDHLACPTQLLANVARLGYGPRQYQCRAQITMMLNRRLVEAIDEAMPAHLRASTLFRWVPESHNNRRQQLRNHLKAQLSDTVGEDLDIGKLFDEDGPLAEFRELCDVHQGTEYANHCLGYASAYVQAHFRKLQESWNAATPLSQELPFPLAAPNEIYATPEAFCKEDIGVIDYPLTQRKIAKDPISLSVLEPNPGSTEPTPQMMLLRHQAAAQDWCRANHLEWPLLLHD
ncbi:hypothetical protein SISSUDRAFT_1037641 [Sistotremastrum suecicum HHB10207 ss-3]|uniref:Uncharacterized protein n=1 Tax=Sistotremastrum suecicum HHB10207 ss-3 TaxID=1314776 RepID=A0A165XVG8_9AGAM|nr:hypothetical protein SISSUDRAFT_1037641 [Sistotremastrum suecicum HHB10207 ss-3]